MKKSQYLKLRPIMDSDRDYEALEARLKRFFYEELYKPLIKILRLPAKTVKNSKSENRALADALFRGQITYSKSKLYGRFSASVSKELRDLGAKFDRRAGAFVLPESLMPPEIKSIVSSSLVRMEEQMAKVDKHLAEIVPKEFADKFKCEDLFNKDLWRADTEFRKNVKKVAVVPGLSESARGRIAEDWQENMNLWIRDWTAEQIKDLRKDILEATLSGARRESSVPAILKVTKTIQKSHGEALRKAKFLARQETRLLMAKFKEVRYDAAGVKEYEWRCVHRPHDETPSQHTPGNVRYAHGKLEGKIFRWDAPPVTTNPGQPTRRNNPGQDFNCRCFARPVVKFK